MLNVGAPELLVIVVVALLVFGPNRLPELARQAGKAMGEVRRMADGFQAEVARAAEPTTSPSPTDRTTEASADAVGTEDLITHPAPPGGSPWPDSAPPSS